MPRSVSPGFTLLWAAAAVLLAACGPAKLDIRDSRSVALTFIDAYNKRDIQTLVQLISPDARSELEGPLTLGEKSPDWRITFEPGLARDFGASKGVEGPRYDEKGRMFFGVSRNAEGRVLIIQVFKAFGAYYVGAVESREGLEFDAMPAASPETPEQSPGNDS